VFLKSPLAYAFLKKEYMNNNNNKCPKCGHSWKNNNNSGGFLRFWEAYPLKKSKFEAQKAWKTQKINEETCEEIIKKVNLFKNRDKKWLGGYIPHASTFLNQRRWEDEVEIDIKKTAPAFNQPYYNAKKKDDDNTKKRVGKTISLRDVARRFKEKGII
jgi:hypothetical protein